MKLFIMKLFIMIFYNEIVYNDFIDLFMPKNVEKINSCMYQYIQ